MTDPAIAAIMLHSCVLVIGGEALVWLSGTFIFQETKYTRTLLKYYGRFHSIMGGLFFLFAVYWDATH